MQDPRDDDFGSDLNTKISRPTDTMPISPYGANGISEQVAKTVLANFPLSVEGVSALAFAAAAHGDGSKAGKLISQLASLGWRNTFAQLTLAQAYLQEKDYRESAMRIDAAMRTQPASLPLYDMMDGLLDNGQLTEDIAQRLALKPNWRTRYLVYGENLTPESMLRKSTLIKKLDLTNAPASRQEVLPLVNRFAAYGKYDEAFSLWQASHDITRVGVADPSFGHLGVSDMAPFEWTVLPLLGVTVSPNIESSRGRSLLEIVTDGSASGSILRQIVRLPPGFHRLSYLTNQRVNYPTSFTWSLTCVQSKQSLLEDTSRAPPPYKFIVPKNCDYQVLQLYVSNDINRLKQQILLQQLSID